ncbi:MAG: hypothetical protein JNK54_07885 [Elusimicrobia bacterium]|jgi:hypothetical protein|nr:hypothetical protein [Elusimicrobiota bacterium]
MESLFKYTLEEISMQKITFPVLLMVGLFLMGCAYQHRPLLTPEIEISNATSMDHVKTTVKTVLRKIGWTIESETPGITIASLRKTSLYAKIEVDYSGSQIKIKHLESENLNYSNRKKGGETIHSRYLTWVRNIEKNLNRALNPLPIQ